MPQPAPPAAQSSRASLGGRMLSSLLFTVAGLVAVLGVLAMIVLWFGKVRGDEFSPDLFERRAFIYYELPLVQRQVTPIIYLDTTGDMEKFLTTNSYVARLPNAPRWDVVQARRANRLVAEGEAKILTTCLDKETFKEEGPLMKWTKAQPTVAKVFWPAVATVVRDGHYVFLPELLELAASAKDAKKLQAAVHRQLAEKYALWGAIEEQRADPAAALAAFQRALEHDPQHAAAKNGAARLQATAGL